MLQDLRFSAEARDAQDARNTRAGGRGGGNLLPIGSLKDRNIRGLGPKYDSDYSLWALKPHYLSPWTLRGYPGP